MEGNRYMAEDEIEARRKWEDKLDEASTILEKYNDGKINLEMLIVQFKVLNLVKLIGIDNLPYRLVKDHCLDEGYKCLECEAVEAFLKENEKPIQQHPDAMMRKIISNLPVYFIEMNVKPQMLDKYWDLIPTHKREYLKDHLPCYEHHNTGRTQVDGPPDSKSKCAKCRRQERNLSNAKYDFYL